MLGIPGLEPMQLFGLSGVAVVEHFVKYLVDQWKLPLGLAPVMNLLVGVVWNVFLGVLLLHTSLVSAVYVGLVTGIAANAWHEATKPTTVVNK